MPELSVSSENQRADYPRYFRMLEKKLKKLQKSLSKKLSEEYDAMVVEDLNMKGMSQALNFEKV